MQLPPLKYVFWFVLLLCGACQSSRPSFLFSPHAAVSVSDNATAALPEPENSLPATQFAKTAAFPPEKVLSAANHSNPIPALYRRQLQLVGTALPEKKALKVRKLSTDPDPEPTKENPYPKHEHRLSGILIGVGIAALLASLVLALVGSGAAGLVAIIGGIIFIGGFIVCLDSMLGD